MPFFSIIIPIYKRKDFLLEALQSCRNQSYKDYEVIIIDDGSPEKVINQIPTEYIDNVTVKYYYIENCGAGLARNFGVDKSQGQFIVFLDSDDSLMPYALNFYHDCITKNNINIIISKRLNTEIITNDQYKEIEQNSYQYINYKDYLSKDIVLEFGASNIIVSKKEFKKVGGFKARSNKTAHAEDHDLMLRLGTTAGFALITNPHCILYRVHDSNSVKEYTKVVHGIKELIKSEYRSIYPGGKRRLFSRYYTIGTPTFHWSIRLLKRKSLKMAFNLFVYSMPFTLTYVFLKPFYSLKAKHYSNGETF
ncbi:glycosyltransferase family 2 protein [Spirosoma oryzicola]|uniref:glycosyltransferase family 2 protein n=1 Tax=Spirosoma oryzicola TaxID=2898794 RepID=UPI001E34A394|nr:glycosyltransferase family 2 protein [Spirosoma oryzicola]UHG92240.1 glycosyltransferase [Spirosoma oryzicola]